MDITAIILCGGSGSRLWPLSRTNFPKQFLRLFGKYSLFQETILRIKDITDKIFVITSDKHYWIAEEHLDEIGIEANIITEPTSKNTAPAIALGLRHVEENQSVLILPSDNKIEDNDSFQTFVKNIYEYTKDYIITFGIKPTYPETGYGYIELGEIISNNIYKVNRFVEKPDETKAREYISSNKYLWNSGMFFSSKSVLLEEFNKFDKTLYDIATQESIDIFLKAKDISFDYAIMEHTDRGLCAKFDMHWSDVGSWACVYDELPKDEHQNAKIGDGYIAIKSNRNLILSENRLVVSVGIDNIILVDTADVTLVLNKNHAQDIKYVFNILKSQNDKRADESNISYKPYGYYITLEERENFKIRKLVLKPKKNISKQMHHHRAEHWIVLKGTAKVTIDNTEKYFHENESFFVPKSTWHYIENPGFIDLEMLEVQSGEYLKEDDTIRV